MRSLISKVHLSFSALLSPIVSPSLPSFSLLLQAGTRQSNQTKTGNGALVDFGITFRGKDFAWGAAFGVGCIVLGLLAVFITTMILGEINSSVGKIEVFNIWRFLILYYFIFVSHFLYWFYEYFL